MRNVIRIGLITFVAALGAFDAQAQVQGGGPKDSESIRVVLSKISGLGTADHNASAKPVSYKGVRMIALTAGDRYSLASNGTFAITDQVSQLNFVLPSRLFSLSVRESVCLDRLQGMKTAGNASGKMEISFKGKKLANGNYVVLEMLGCGDLVTAAAQPGQPIPTPRPTATPTPRPTATATPKK
jgi:hypothetical protein